MRQTTMRGHYKNNMPILFKNISAKKDQKD